MTGMAKPLEVICDNEEQKECGQDRSAQSKASPGIFRPHGRKRRRCQENEYGSQERHTMEWLIQTVEKNGAKSACGKKDQPEIRPERNGQSSDVDAHCQRPQIRGPVLPGESRKEWFCGFQHRQYTPSSNRTP